jgi:hypothetical protein
MTRGRTAPTAGGSFGLIDTVTAVTGAVLPPGIHLDRQHRRILACCQHPTTVVDLASDVNLPVGVVRVLLGDLSEYGLLRVVTAPRGRVTNQRLLKDVLDALHAL